MSDKKEKKDKKEHQQEAITNNGVSADVENVVQEKLPDMTPADPNAVFENIQQKLQTTQAVVQPVNPVAQHWKKARKPRFEIELYEEQTSDETGEITGYKKVQSEYPIIIEAATRADLQEHAQRYRLCHQRMKIVRKIDDGDAMPQSQSTQSQQLQHVQTQTQVTQQVVVQRQKPKFYKIGDIDIKDDNGQIFQKQWMKLSESEMANLRVINDKNNSIVNLNGKHIEMKKWVLVDKSEDESSALEEGLK